VSVCACVVFTIPKKGSSKKQQKTSLIDTLSQTVRLPLIFIATEVTSNEVAALKVSAATVSWNPLADFQSQVGLRIRVADVLHHGAGERVIVRDQASFDVVTQEVTQRAAEVFMTWEGHEAAAVCEHADEAA
jgi:hypothetical protein